jgi:nucleotide-binding universal stress UspA family protein
VIEATQGARPDTTGPILVGVETGGRSNGAVLWGAEEAQRARLPLRLVTAYPDEAAAGGEQSSLRSDLTRVAQRLTLSTVDYQVGFGAAPAVLLDVTWHASVIVVGRGGRGSMRPRTVGATAVAVAAQAHGPVVVAPELWWQPSRSTAPLVVGLAGAGPDDDADALELAFDRADRIGVPLIVVRAVTDGANPRDLEADLESRLLPWRVAHPDVEVLTRCPPEPAAIAILGAARVAQLTLLGRARGRYLPDGSLGPTTMRVIEWSDHPVAVVPLRRPERSAS